MEKHRFAGLPWTALDFVFTASRSGLHHCPIARETLNNLANESAERALHVGNDLIAVCYAKRCCKKLRNLNGMEFAILLAISAGL